MQPLLLLSLLFIGGLTMAQLAGMWLIKALHPGFEGQSITELTTAYPGSWTTVRWLQVVHSTLTFGLPAILAWRLVQGSFLPVYPVAERRSAGTMLFIPLLLFTILPLMQIMYLFNQQMDIPGEFGRLMKEMEEQMGGIIAGLMADQSPEAIAFNVFLMVILAAVTEELFFRGALQRFLQMRLGDEHAAVFFSSILFSAVHMQFYGFLPRMALGILFGYIYLRTRRLIAPILAHALFNGSQVASMYLFGKAAVDENSGGAAAVPFSVTLSSTLLFLMMYYAFHTYTEKKH